MKQSNVQTTNLTMVGEEISHELGAKMVKDFQDQNPSDSIGNYIGRNIIEKILEQPGCVGIRFYNAINELGRKTLVYVGVDANDDLISEYVGINAAGELVKEKGIVADRSGNPTAPWHWSQD
jgi:hypothetical protein